MPAGVIVRYDVSPEIHTFAIRQVTLGWLE